MSGLIEGPAIREELAGILAPYKGQGGSLIPILQGVQERLGYLPEEAVREIAKFLGISKNEVFGVATFFTQFRFTPPGRHTMKVCLGTACHVRGGERILETVERELGVEPGQTTEDRKYSLERVACFGCCALSPVVVVDNEVYSRMTQSKVKEVLSSYK